MSSAVGIATALTGLGVAGGVLWRSARAYWRFRGRRLVACPESGQFAAIDLATWRMAGRAVFRQPAVMVRDCSRLHQGVLCGLACVRRVAEAPEACLVATIVSQWYRGKNCACCGKALEQPARWGHLPCLMSPDRHLLDWKAIPAENIPPALDTHAPVCWNCRVAETHIW